jgi:mxaD protein
LTALLGVVVLTLGSGTPARAAGAEVNRVLPFPAKVIWGLIGEFSTIDIWHPAIESVKLYGNGGKGLYRQLSLAGGGEIHELLLAYSFKERYYGYAIVRSPLPVKNYTSVLTVQSGDNEESALVIWSSNFEPEGATEEEAVKVIEGIYEAGIERVRQLLAGERPDGE